MKKSGRGEEEETGGKYKRKQIVKSYVWFAAFMPLQAQKFLTRRKNFRNETEKENMLLQTKRINGKIGRKREMNLANPIGGVAFCFDAISLTSQSKPPVSCADM